MNWELSVWCLIAQYFKETQLMGTFNGNCCMNRSCHEFECILKRSFISIRRGYFSPTISMGETILTKIYGLILSALFRFHSPSLPHSLSLSSILFSLVSLSSRSSLLFFYIFSYTFCFHPPPSHSFSLFLISFLSFSYHSCFSSFFLFVNTWIVLFSSLSYCSFPFQCLFFFHNLLLLTNML